MNRRVFLLVMDSMGIGAMPDAGKWGDEGSNTLGAICRHPAFHCPNLTRLGLFHIDGVNGGAEEALGSYARMTEASCGKDTTIGHWEIAGLLSPKPFPTYPDGFPPEILKKFSEAAGRGILCNKPYSGTQVIRDYGEEHCRTGKLIVYTSADSVFQVAAHEEIVPPDELYRYCRIARQILTGEHAVGRVIARPFEGSYPFVRTPRRHDFSLPPPDQTMVDLLMAAGYATIAVGKISDIFAGRGFTEAIRTQNNRDGMIQTIKIAGRDFTGLCFVNLVDFDMLYGHRNDVEGYACAMSEFDVQLGQLLPLLREEDLLLVTADHGCDPSTPSTDHSREYTPLLITGPHVRHGVNLGTRPTFADISATVLDYFHVPQGKTAGTSLLPKIL